MYIMKSLNDKTKGAASLITVIFVSIVLTIMVLGFVRLAVNEQRQSSDDDLTTRAFYAAESGIEDAKRAIRDYLNGDDPTDPNDIAQFADLNADDCTLPNHYTGELSTLNEFDTEYTCMLLDLTPPNYETVIDKNETKQIELRTKGGVTFTEIYISWHINDDVDGDGLSPTLRAGADTNLPPESAWSYPAMLRTNLFSYPNANITRAEIDDSSMTAFLNPTNVGGVTTISYNAGTSENHAVHQAKCSIGAVGGYVCTQLIRVSAADANRHFVLRLTSLYDKTHVRVEVRNSASAIISFEGNQALIDVTGRAGDVYRRIETRVSLDSNFGDLLPDEAILSADDLCKNMAVPAAGDPGYLANDCTRP